MKIFVLFAAGLLSVLPANADDAPADKPVETLKPVDPLIVNPKSIGQHACFPKDTNWVGSGSSHIAEVHVRFDITADGAVTDVVVDASSGIAELDALTLTCAQRWRYQPATKDGQPVDLPWSATVRYSHG